ncbi:tryptophan-rich sensory protein [Arthrobacter agilis]|uniref:TspO/MBR family protein n=1 Tax=Arthrobacter agilis TaxID=37921 RepID=UPI002366EB03|nr:TspO/MBR family protein [Arthrobacter agilis]WDF33704.1 tryptophan-rich sensory protein [Arthrobacter agilis]
MSTPKNPGPRLPDRPVREPSIAQEKAPAKPPSDTSRVLERLKAAQPRSAVRADEESRGPAAERTGGAGSPSQPAARSSDGPGAGTSTGRPSTGDTRTTATDVGTAPRRRAAAERATLAAEKARTAAGVAGRAVGRGSSATLSHVRSWNPDIVRQSVVTVCAIACILGSAAGVGALGGPSIRDAAGGLFAPDATLLAPSSSAFSIWSVIYAGLVAYTAFQWLPSQRRTPRQRRLGWTVAASMLLNLAWILSAQAGGLTLSLVVIMLLFFALLSAVRTLNLHPNETRLEGALVDTPIGLYLGWVLLAAGANAAAFFTATGADLFGWEGTTWAMLGIIAILITAAVVCSTDRGRLSVAVATSWGFLWIAVERSIGRPAALSVAFVAALAVFLLLITAGSRRHRVDHAYRRWLRAQEDAQREPIDLLGDEEARS